MPVITIARQFGPAAGRWSPPEPAVSMTAEHWLALMRLVLARALTAPRLRAA